MTALRFLLDSDEFDVVGVKCHSPAKVGVDVGTIADRPSVGLAATSDPKLVEDLQPDCVVFMPRDDFVDPTSVEPAPEWFEDVLRILASGANVVSPLQSPMHWRQLRDGAVLRERLQRACEIGGTTAFFTGVLPGFFNDYLPIALSSGAREIRQVRMLEAIDFGPLDAPETYSAMGFGAPSTGGSASIRSLYRSSWGCSIWLVADALGVELDEIQVTDRTFAAESEYVSPGGFVVGEGMVGAIDVTMSGIVAGSPLIVTRHIARMGADIAPEWPRVGDLGGYRIEVDGAPPLVGEFPLGNPGGTGTCVGDSIVITAARCVNAIYATVAAPAGYRLLNETPRIGGGVLHSPGLQHG
ncbi:hypothetical protein [Jatrophihabitans sp.]|uniref:hypothetical protein n=1 Tax=Jatrophihabitans sp. TaxID=1932789 RepID=UPI0030C68CCF